MKPSIIGSAWKFPLHLPAPEPLTESCPTPATKRPNVTVPHTHNTIPHSIPWSGQVSSLQVHPTLDFPDSSQVRTPTSRYPEYKRSQVTSHVSSDFSIENWSHSGCFETQFQFATEGLDRKGHPRPCVFQSSFSCTYLSCVVAQSPSDWTQCQTWETSETSLKGVRLVIDSSAQKGSSFLAI